MVIDLPFVWAGIIAFAVLAYVILDGFDLGVGMLSPFIAHNDHDRRILLNSIGPVWDGNEVWLLVAGALAVAIAWSRVFLGLHFVSDIAAGVVLGVASAVTAQQCLAWVGRRRVAPALRPMAGSETR
mgnify:CR=1 FL=1